MEHGVTRIGSSGPSSMSPADLAQARSDLTSEFARLSEKLSTHQAFTAADRGATGGGDSADVGARTSQIEHDAVVSDHEQLLLQQTSAALQRIKDGTYQSCESCANPIGAARLQAFPRATMCLHCREIAEHHH